MATNLHRGDTNGTRAVSVRTDTLLAPGEGLEAVMELPGGEIQAREASFFVLRRGSRGTTAWLNWLLPASFNEDDVEEAARQMRREHTDRPTRLRAGEPYHLFTIENRQGGRVRGFIRLRSEIRSEASVTNATASVWIKMHSMAHLIWFSATVPAGYALEGDFNTPDPTEGEAHTSRFGAEYHVSWRWPRTFGDVHAAAQAQIADAVKRSPIKITEGEPLTLLSLTNAAGEVFRGTLELVAPARFTE